MSQLQYTADEIIVACISRHVEDGEVLAQGLATPLVAAGYLLAWKTHAPNVYFASAIGQSICRVGVPLGLARVEAQWLDQAMNTFGFARAVADLMPSVQPKEYFRPAQVDRNGSFNNIAFGKSYERPRLRLPGIGGIPDVTNYLPKVYLYVPRHSRVTFVKGLDHRSGLGHVSDRRRGAGPTYLISDLGQFDFENGSMRLLSAHPGVELDRIRAKTGFELEIPPGWRTTDPPTETELTTLRQEVDPLGIRRLELMSGADRRQALSQILDAETGGPQANG